MKKYVIFTLFVLCILHLTACVPEISYPQENTSAQTEQHSKDFESSEQTSEELITQEQSSIDQTTEPVSDTEPDTTEEITTFGPLHFPEDTTQ
ncbi:MAG: hypothetical protein IJW70_01095 [Clostridia bacterium]|nr:hypothetical protein [Clostridia bacterium]